MGCYGNRQRAAAFHNMKGIHLTSSICGLLFHQVSCNNSSAEHCSMVCVKNMRHVCGNHFCYCATLPLQTKLQKICKRSCTSFHKFMCVRNQRSSEEAFRFSAQLCHKHMFGKKLQRSDCNSFDSCYPSNHNEPHPHVHIQPPTITFGC